MRYSSWTATSITVVLVAVFFRIFLPTLMSKLLRHMFTAPNQKPWPYGKLRLIDCDGIPAQPLNSVERIRKLIGNNKNEEITAGSSANDDDDDDDDDEPDFLHKDNDVWVVSYVKSGTTWTIGILAALWDHPAAEYSGNLQKVTRKFCPQPELPDLGWKDDGFGHSIKELNDWNTTAPGTTSTASSSSGHHHGRCFKSHWPNADFILPAGSNDNDNNNERRASATKIIYVMRNPIDQMISHWNQVWGMGFHYGTENRTFVGGWNDFVQDWFDGNVENGKWFDHVAGWYERIVNNNSDNSNTQMLLVRYEDLKTNTEDTIRRISDFVVDDDEQRKQQQQTMIERVMNLTSFDKMREADEKDLGLQFMRYLGVLRKHHIRQGKTSTSSSSKEEEQKSSSSNNNKIEEENKKLLLSKDHIRLLHEEYKRALEPLGMPKEWIILN